MKLVSQLSIGAAAIAVGGVAGGTIVAAKNDSSPAATPGPRTASPLPVRTVVETHTIHRTRHVRAHAPAAAPRPATAQPAAAAPPAVVQPAAVVRASAPTASGPSSAPVQTRSSGGGTGGEHEGGDDHGGDHGDDGGIDD